MTHTLIDAKIAVISGGIEPLSILSRKSGDAISAALKSHFVYVEHLEFDATLEQRLEALRPDVVFPAISDFKLVKLLETFGIHYVGSRLHATYLLQKKKWANHFLRYVGVPVEEDLICSVQDDVADVVVKAMHSFTDGCLVGNSESYGERIAKLCKSTTDVISAIENALAEGDTAVIENCFSGWREISVAVLKQDESPPKVLPIAEVVYSANDQMFSPSDVTYCCPTVLHEEIATKVERYALTTFNVLGLDDFCRIDMVISRDGDIRVKEIHAVPYLSAAGSLFMLSAQAAGISFEDLTISSVRQALSRASNEIKIASRALSPGCDLSNFAPYSFVLDDMEIAGGMEGLLQSLKTPDEKLQRELCGLTGKEVKRRGAELSSWQLTQTLWWRGQAMERSGSDYQAFLRRAYDALFDQSDEFRSSLKQTGNRKLTHTLGNMDPHNTVLSEKEFISVLGYLRGRMNSERHGNIGERQPNMNLHHPLKESE